MRVGIGYDIHRFEAGRALILGGVTFEGETGLAGHSDADVVLHAITDALLGAAWPWRYRHPLSAGRRAVEGRP